MVGPRALKFAEVALKAGQVLLLVGMVWAGWALVTRAPSPIQVATAEIAAFAAAQASESAHPLDRYAPIWQRDLRQPPVPPEPKAKPVEETPPPRLPTLLGTFVEGERTWAHVITADQRSRLIQAGDTVDQYAVAAIEPGRVRLERGSESRWLEVPKKRPEVRSR